MKTRNSALRTAYMWRLAGRVVVLLLCGAIAVWKPEELNVLRGMSFFERFSVLHFLWSIWVVDMLLQLLSIKHTPLGSQKLFKLRFKPIRKKSIRRPCGTISLQQPRLPIRSWSSGHC